MKKDFLKRIDKSSKVDFLNKLRSGQFTLSDPYSPQPPLNFDLQKNGRYKCRETGKVMSKGQIESLQGYKVIIEVVGTREQVAGTKPASSYVLVPLSTHEYLASMLKSKFAEHITWDANGNIFRSEERGYTFDDLMRIRNESPEIEFLMDGPTKQKYLECLEKWC